MTRPPAPKSDDIVAPSIAFAGKTTPPAHAAHFRSTDGEWQTLANHLVSVSILSSALAQKLQIGVLGELIGLLHDLGKYSKSFQDYIKSAVGAYNQDEDEEWVDTVELKGKVDHSSAGAQLVWKALVANGSSEGRLVAQVAALCIASHHSGLIDCIVANEARYGQDGFTSRMEKSDDKTHLVESRGQVDEAIRKRSSVLLEAPSLVNELSAAIRRISSHNSGPEGCGSKATLQQWGLLVRFAFSCLIDADRIDTANFESPRAARFRPLGAYAAWPKLIRRLESHLQTLAPSRPIDELRQQISDLCLKAAGRPKGTYTLSVPTGGGKTLASLRFALHHAAKRNLDRIIFVIPFTSIIDQNAQVVRAILEPDSAPEDKGRVVLEHHGSVTPERQTWREKVLCENWDAPVVYTTMVQLLEALFGSGTRGARRMHQLANTVLVFDEVQTLPIRCVHLFNNAINFLAEHCNSTVMLCTATQPLLHRVNPELGAMRLSKDHELIPDRDALFAKLQRVHIRDQRKPGGWTHTEVTQLALQEVARDASCLVIVNTKAAAQDLYRQARADLPEEAVFHLSTDMCPMHRKRVLKAVRDRLDSRKPILCVSTQLIEAGVDIDFRVVIRFLAGLDSIAQAAGRCNRNGSDLPGVVHVVNPETESLGALPDIAIGLEKAQRVLDDFRSAPQRYQNDLVSPLAMEDYYRYYFLDRAAEMSYSVKVTGVGDDTLLNQLSVNRNAVGEYARRCRSEPNLLFRQAFMTAAKAFKAIDSPTQGVIVPYGDAGKELINDLCAAFDVTKTIDLLRTAQQYTVNVFPNVLTKLMDLGALHEVQPDTRILCLDPRYYSDQFGISTEPVVPMEALNA